MVNKYTLIIFFDKFSVPTYTSQIILKHSGIGEFNWSVI